MTQNFNSLFTINCLYVQPPKKILKIAAGDMLALRTQKRKLTKNDSQSVDEMRKHKASSTRDSNKYTYKGQNELTFQNSKHHTQQSPNTDNIKRKKISKSLTKTTFQSLKMTDFASCISNGNVSGENFLANKFDSD